MEHIPKYLLTTVAAALLFLFSSGTIAAAGEGPDEVIIDSLALLYEPVIFDHAMHEDVSEGTCALCHHHTLGTAIENESCMKCHAESGGTDEISCGECHSSQRFEVEYLAHISADNELYHRDPLGLKAAYHIRCMNCHAEYGVANGCQDCHGRNDAGDKFFHAGSYKPPENTEPAGGGH